MPGGFLKKLGTASCGMTGTLVAVALVWAATGLKQSEIAPARMRATKDHRTRQYMDVSVKLRDLVRGMNRAGNVPEAACRCKELLRTGAAWRGRFRTTAPRVLLSSTLFARGQSSKRRTGPVGAIAEVVVNTPGQRGGARTGGLKRSTLTTAVPCGLSRTRTVTAPPAVSCTAYRTLSSHANE